jgi:hypothetical protein
MFVGVAPLKPVGVPGGVVSIVMAKLPDEDQFPVASFSCTYRV